MSIKLLINGIAGAGKTSLLDTMGEETFVVSRDGKSFGFPVPHMLVKTYVDMNTFLYGGTVDNDGESEYIDGITDKLEAYSERFGSYPVNVVFDSVSQITMDVLDTASQTPDSWGSQGKEATAELAKFTKFIHEYLEINGVNIIMMNHVTEEKVDGKSTGCYVPFGQGQFKSKGAFYATVNEAITIVPRGNNREVLLRGADKQARTTCKELPDKQYIVNTVNPDKSKKLKDDESFFNLKDHMDYLMSKQQDVGKWSL